MQMSYNDFARWSARSTLAVVLCALASTSALAVVADKHLERLEHRVEDDVQFPSTAEPSPTVYSIVHQFHHPKALRSDRKYLTYANVDPTRGFWPNGVISWRYSDVGRNAAISASAADALNTINAAMAQWSAVCRVTFVYLGMTTSLPGLGNDTNIGDGQNVIGWASFAGNQTGLTGVRWFGSSFPLPPVEGDIGLDNSFNPNLGGTVLHELGHLLGLEHSDVNGAVLSGPPLSNYNSLTNLQADDIAGCQSIYGAPLPTSITISGKIGPSTNLNTALPGATLCTSGSGITCGTPDGSGNFSCTVNSGWTGSIHPRVSGYRVQARKFANVTANQTQNMPAQLNAGLSCNLDVDRNGLIEPDRDGVAILRRMMGQSQPSMSGLAGVCAQETSSTGLFANADPANFNVTGGGISALTDGLVLLRKMRGAPDSALLQSINDGGATAGAVNAWLSSNCGFPLP
ncbi:MAG: hypothetical protein EAZ43_02825 [Betaproteobacteria bacterium]|nr:MAG: hypothetical protein EAZ43_02825 [Betaproteobacteria bacterium]